MTLTIPDAAIARHKQMLAAFMDVVQEEDAAPLDDEISPAGIAYKEHWEAAHEVNEAAIWAICEVEPATLAGIAALAAYGAEIYDGEIAGLANAERLLESIATAAKRLAE